ncbi:sulfatase-like hydrolase/transferase [bacterium]|nr:sulfatase-like hydrolase/transferase [bacterium]
MESFGGLGMRCMAFLMLAVAWACAPEADKSGNATEGAAPNLLLVIIDTLRTDHSSVYGYERDTTPHLRRFAQQGSRFDATYAPLPGTGPTHATVFTSLYPIAHGVVKNGLVLAPEHETLAEILRIRGYQTAAVVSSFALARKFGYAQGFDTYQDDFDPDRSTIRFRKWEGHLIAEGFDRRAGQTTTRAIRWLDEGRRPGTPFFLFVHYFDPHDPYDPPPAFRRWASPGPGELSKVERATARYDGEIAYADAEIGRLLAALTARALDADTLVVITADHGEGLSDHGYMYHDIQLYEEAVRVPLIVRWPGRIEVGRALKAPIELTDLMPTILGLMEVHCDGGRFQGVSRAAALRGEALIDPENTVFLQRRPFPPSRIAGFSVAGDAFGARVGRWKYIEASEEGARELFDLESDPGETENLYADFPTRAEELSALIYGWRQTHGRAAGHSTTISEEDRRRLRAMGYAE